MCDTLENRTNGYLNPKLLSQLTEEALLEGLVNLPFAAWKFPEAAKVGSGITLSQEQLAVTKNQGGSNIDYCHATSLSADAFVDESQLFHFSRIEEVTPIEHDWMGHDLSGAV